MELFIIILVILLLLLLEGFFSGSEIALVHADKIRLHARASQGHKGSKLVLEMFQRPDILLTTTLVGTNISVVVLTTLGTLVMIRLFGSGGEFYATTFLPRCCWSSARSYPRASTSKRPTSLRQSSSSRSVSSRRCCIRSSLPSLLWLARYPGWRVCAFQGTSCS